MHTYIYPHPYAYAYICTRTHMRMHYTVHTLKYWYWDPQSMHKYAYTHTHLYKRIHIHIHTHMHIYIYMHVRTHTHIHIYTHIHTHIQIIYMHARKHVWNDGAAATARETQLYVKKLRPSPCPLQSGGGLPFMASSPIARPRGTTDKRRTTTINSSSIHHHDSAPSRPHPLICTGAEPIHPVPAWLWPPETRSLQCVAVCCNVLRLLTLCCLSLQYHKNQKLFPLVSSNRPSLASFVCRVISVFFLWHRSRVHSFPWISSNGPLLVNCVCHVLRRYRSRGHNKLPGYQVLDW